MRERVWDILSQKKEKCMAQLLLQHDNSRMTSHVRYLRSPSVPFPSISQPSSLSPEAVFLAPGFSFGISEGPL